MSVPWRYVIADADGVSVGEAHATQRAFSPGISRPATASFQIRTSDPMWEAITAGDTSLRVYDSGGNLVLYGPVIADEESGSGQGSTVKVTATDLAAALGKRYVGKDTTGVGTTYTATDSGAIAFTVLAALNAENPTGITAGTAGAFIARTITYLWKRALDAITELGAIEGSYEWALRYADAATPTVYLDLAASLGDDLTASLFFEYGYGLNNCSAYSRTRTTAQQADQVWVLGSGSTIVSSASDATAIMRYGLLEDVISYGDIAASSLLDALASAHVAIRKEPRTVVSMTPFAQTAPRYGVDWNLGDLVTARVYVDGVARVNGTARIWGADITIDEVGVEHATLTLVPA